MSSKENHDDGDDNSRKVPTVTTPLPKKRKRIVTLPRDVAAYYNKRRVRERSSSCEASQHEMFRTETEREQALNSLQKSRTGSKVHTRENNNVQTGHQLNDCNEHTVEHGHSDIVHGQEEQNNRGRHADASEQNNRGRHADASGDGSTKERCPEKEKIVRSVRTDISAHGAEAHTPHPRTNVETPYGADAINDRQIVNEEVHSSPKMNDQGLVSDSSEGERNFPVVGEEEIQEQSDLEEEDNQSVVCVSINSDQPHGEQVMFPPPRLREMKVRMSTIVKWERMLSCVSMSGEIRMNHVQHRFLSKAMKTMDPSVNMQAYAGVKNKFWRSMLAYAAAKSTLIHLKDSVHEEPIEKVKTDNAGLKSVRDCVRIVLPSEWAKVDVITDGFFKSVYEQCDDDYPEALSIENAPIIQHRRIICGVDLVLWALYNDAVCPCEYGDNVTFNCNKPVRTVEKGGLYESAWTVTSVQGTPHSIVHGTVGPLWCVTTEHGEEEMNNSTVNEKEVFRLLQLQQFTTFEAIQQSSRNQRTLAESRKPNILQLCVGDVCMFLRSTRTQVTQTSPSVHCLFVGSPVSHMYGASVELLVWVTIARSAEGVKYVKTLGQRAIRGLPKWVSGQRVVPLPRGKRLRNKGILPCGTKYYVYRIALYADGFKQFKSLANTKNVVGVYMLPLGLPSRKRRSTDAARILTIVPDGQDVRTVFRRIEDDLITAATEGVVGKDPYGNEARIFVDPVSFYGDYPAVTSMTDVRGHTATAFCTFCTMRRRTQAAGRSLLHLSQAHSRRIGYMRFHKRTCAIRERNPPKDVMQALGLAKEDGRTLLPSEETPLVHYANRVRELGAGNMRSTPVMSIDFDPCLNVAAAPDHLFTGMIGDVLHVCLMSMDSDGRREEAEVRIIHAAKTNGLPHEKRMLRWDGGKCVGIVSLTMTTKLCLLFCSVPVFDMEFKRTRNQVFQLPNMLQRLVSLAFVVPSEEASGAEAREMCTAKGQLKVQGELNRTARQYIQLCDTIFRSKNPYGKELNKPNVHRALELCVLTIPSFGHARNCSEMVLESMHRTVKRWLEKNTHQDSHLTSVEHSILRDWLSRIHSLYNQWLSSSDEENNRAETGLQRLLLGEKSLGLQPQGRGVPAFMTEFRVAMANALRPPVLEEMGRCDHFGEGGEGAYAWELTGVVRRKEGEDESVTLEEGMTILESYYDGLGKHDVHLYERRVAKYIVQRTTHGKRRSYQHNRLSRGTAVSIVTRTQGSESTVVRGCRTDDERGVLQFYCVHELIEASNGDAWCTAKHLTSTGDNFSVGQNPTCVLLLGKRVRRACVMHTCDENCRVLVNKRNVKHSTSLLRGGRYQLKSRIDGYPPHVG